MSTQIHPKPAQAGDQVTCLQAEASVPTLTGGGTYTIERVSMGGYLWLESPQGATARALGPYVPSRFQHTENPPA